LSHSTSPFFVMGFFKIGSLELFAWAGFKPISVFWVIRNYRHESLAPGASSYLNGWHSPLKIAQGQDQAISWNALALALHTQSEPSVARFVISRCVSDPPVLFPPWPPSIQMPRWLWQPHSTVSSLPLLHVYNVHEYDENFLICKSNNPTALKPIMACCCPKGKSKLFHVVSLSPCDLLTSPDSTWVLLPNAIHSHN
jgi:hypothetical protein